MKKFLFDDHRRDYKFIFSGFLWKPTRSSAKFNLNSSSFVRGEILIYYTVAIDAGFNTIEIINVVWREKRQNLCLQCTLYTRLDCVDMRTPVASKVFHFSHPQNRKISIFPLFSLSSIFSDWKTILIDYFFVCFHIFSQVSEVQRSQIKMSSAYYPFQVSIYDQIMVCLHVGERTEEEIMKLV